MPFNQQDLLVKQVEYNVAVRGQQYLNDLARQMGDVNQEMVDQQVALGQGTIGLEEYRKSVAGLIRDLAGLTEESALAEGALKNNGKVAADSTRQGAAAARAILEMSRGMEDFALAGFQGVINNIPTTVMAIGTAFDLSTAQVNSMTAAVSILSTGAFVLYKNWDNIGKAIGVSNEAMAGSVERMKELEKLTDRSLAQNEELRKLKQKQADIDRLHAQETEAQQSQRKAVEDIVKDVTEQAIVKGLFESRGGAKLDPTRLKELEFLRRMEQQTAVGSMEEFLFRAKTDPQRFAAVTFGGQTDAEFFAARRAKVAQDAQDEAIKKAQGDLAEALRDPRRLAGLATEVERAPGAFPPDLAKRLRGADPEAQRKMRAFEGALEAGGQADDDRRKKDEEERRQIEHDNNMLRAQGEANERLMHAEQQREKAKEEREAEAARKKAQADRDRARRGFERDQAKDIAAHEVGKLGPGERHDLQQQIAARAMNEGANPAESARVAEETLRLMDKGIDMMRAQQLAWKNVWNEVQRLNGRLDRVIGDEVFRGQAVQRHGPPRQMRTW